MLILIGNPSDTVTLSEAKAYLNVVGDDSDVLITSLLASVIKSAEDITNRQLGTADYILTLESLEDGFKLPKNPIQSIAKIEVLDKNNNYITVDSNKYYLYEDLEIGTIKLLEKLETIDHKEAVKISFKCGYITIPEPIKMWVKYKTMCLFDGKEENISKYVDNMLKPYRIGPLG